MSPPFEPDSFLSGESGTVTGRRARAAGFLRDAFLDLAQALARTGQQLDRLAEATPPRTVLVTGCYVPGAANRLPQAMPELRSARHDVRFAFGSMGDPEPALAADTVRTHLTAGKFQNVNAVLEACGGSPAGFDWTIVTDDDVVLAPRFLDRFVAVCEHFDLALAQPAQTLMSHAAWPITRRRAGSILRETRFVEIGPVTAFRRDAASELIPFPDLRFGWGLDLHWAAVAAERGWRLGIVDALPVRHEVSAVASGYSHSEAVAEGRRFLAGRAFLPSHAVREPVAVHRRIRSIR